MADSDGVNFERLQVELEKSKDKLKHVEDNIKKLTGRDPNEFRSGPRQFRQQESVRGRFAPFGRGSRSFDSDGRQNQTAVFPRFQQFGGDRVGGMKRRDRESDDEEPENKRGLQSSVVAKGAMTREQVLEKQKSDSNSVARNRRMFGVLLGTLQKFNVEEKRKLDAEAKRKEIEKKLEEKAQQEKEAVIKEKQDLKQQQRLARIKIKRLEQKMELAEIHTEWEKQTMYLMNFIRSHSKPHVFYLPKKHNTASEKKLKDSQKLLEAIISERRKQLNEEITELMDESNTKSDSAVRIAAAVAEESEDDDANDDELEGEHVTELVHEEMPQTMDISEPAIDNSSKQNNLAVDCSEDNIEQVAVTALVDKDNANDATVEGEKVSDVNGTENVMKKDADNAENKNDHSDNESDSDSSKQSSQDSSSDSDKDEVMLTSEKVDVE